MNGQKQQLLVTDHGKDNYICRSQFLLMSDVTPRLPSFFTAVIFVKLFDVDSGGVRDTVVARWTAGQQVERSILH